MHKFTKMALTCAITIFLVGCGGARVNAPKSPRTPRPDNALERKHDEGMPTVKNNKRVTSVTEKVTADDAGLTPREREIKLRARQIELRKEMENLEKKKKALEVPSERQARKELEREEKRAARLEAETREARFAAQITGCNPESVWVSPEAERRAYGFVHVNIIVTNRETLSPVTIRDNHLGRLVVENLGPGCSMTMRKVIALDGSNQTPVSYTATGKVSGRVATSNSPSTSLYAGQYQSAQQPIIWDIRLQQ